MPVDPFKNMSELFTVIRNNKVIADKVYGFSVLVNIQTPFKH